MMGMEPDEAAGAAELSELELSAVAEAMNQMMASAAGATTAVLGTEVEIGVPETRTFTSADAGDRRLRAHAARHARARCRCAASRAGSCSSCRTRSSCA